VKTEEIYLTSRQTVLLYKIDPTHMLSNS